jgi:hypothetical protein
MFCLSVHTHVQWKPLIVITLEQREMIKLTALAFRSVDCKNVTWASSDCSLQLHDNINRDHIKRLPLYSAFTESTNKVSLKGLQVRMKDPYRQTRESGYVLVIGLDFISHGLVAQIH